MTTAPRVSLDKRSPAEVAVLEDAAVEEAVLEGEIVEEERTPVATIRAVVTDVAAHHRTQTIARHGLYIAGGAAVVAKRLWDGRTTARYERMMRAAEAAGDRETVLEWEARAAAFRKDRHQRRTDMIELVMRMVLAAPKMALCGVVGLLVLGVLISIGAKDARYIPAPLFFVGHALALLALVVSIAWGPLLLAAPWIAVGALYLVGKSHAGSATGWMAKFEPEPEDAGIVVTADAVVLALQHLRIPEMKKAFKDGFVPVFRLTPIRDGRGYHTIVDLPLGVTAAMVADQRPVLARNMHRAEVETWPADAEKVGTGPAGCLDMWVADPGALSKAAPEYPLLHEGTVDVFEGVPAGVSPRGDVITVPIVGNNLVAGGQMGQGKSNACRVVMLGAALDPIAELNVFVFAANGDFDAYEERLNKYHRGIDDETAEAALEHLREEYAEVARREARLAELGAKKVTRKLAMEHPDLRPTLSLFSECHELFGHKEYGEEAGELAVKAMKRARKTAKWQGYDTQSSRKEAIPPKLVENVSVNACFYVKTWRSNDGFLGDGSFQAGIRATELRPGRDRGTSLITGVSENQYELLKWYFVEVNDDTGFDAAADVIARAVANLAPGTPAGGAVREQAEPAERDLLDDLTQVLDDDRVRVADVPSLLRKLAPDWRPYRDLTGTQLRDQLAELGVRVTNTGNVPRLDPKDVWSALSAELGE
jgi:S-DNA-T family DNA segregation ATPase FtsK/SpoIIIE